MKLAALKAFVRTIAAQHGWDLVALVGVVMTFVGLWLVWPPAAMIVGGALLLALGLLGARADAWRSARTTLSNTNKAKTLRDED